MTLREELQEKTKKAQTDPWETAHMKEFATFLKSKCFKAAEEGKSRICLNEYCFPVLLRSFTLEDVQEFAKRNDLNYEEEGEHEAVLSWDD